ncbi:rRNA pseudouridine synthase [Ectothiorhodospiraceae bacterium BW-2]|nr:rRNA pseudouridine synthase [Ectothiorhodospiraceae bacterium BW-2]
MSEKLHKVMANYGLGSRRQMEAWICDNRVAVNGRPASLGDRVEPSDRIAVDGKVINPKRDDDRQAPPTRVLIYHKPVGEVTTRSDPEGRATIFVNLPPIKRGRWITVGRLDINTAGLLLVTNSGELAHRLMHPSWQIERTYAVRVLGQVDNEMLQRLQQGVELEDGQAAFASIKSQPIETESANQWFHVTLNEGRRREVRRLWESQGVQVNRLIRIAYAGVTLPRWLRPSKWHELNQKELAALSQRVELSYESALTTEAGGRGAPPAIEKNRHRLGAKGVQSQNRLRLGSVLI